jgi:hypothetical protein
VDEFSSVDAPILQNIPYIVLFHSPTIVILCKQGKFYAIPAACTVIGMIFFHIAAFGCKTFKSELSVNSLYSYSYDYKAGYWSVDNGSSCVKFGNFDVSGAFKFGRFIGVVGALMIWAIFFAIVVASFFQYPKPKLVFRTIGISMGVLSFFSFLLLVGLSGDDSLKLAGGGALAILSAFIWAGGAVSMFLCMNERERCVTKTSGPAAPETTAAAKEVDTKNDPETTTNENVDDEV